MGLPLGGGGGGNTPLWGGGGGGGAPFREEKTPPWGEGGGGGESQFSPPLYQTLNCNIWKATIPYQLSTRQLASSLSTKTKLSKEVT